METRRQSHHLAILALKPWCPYDSTWVAFTLPALIQVTPLDQLTI